jgi:putative lipoprotein
VLITPRLAQEGARDPWFGQDKLRHAAMSFATAGFTYAAGTTAGLDHDTALPVALGVAALAGIGKEISDRRKGHKVSYRDLLWDAVGLGAGVLLLRSVR